MHATEMAFQETERQKKDKSIYSIELTLTQMSVYFTKRNFFSSNSIFIFPMAIKSRRTALTDPPILFFDPWRPLTSPVELFCHKRTYASDSCKENSLCQRRIKPLDLNLRSRIMRISVLLEK